ncbi:MAG: GNAT family N-acetyltransferase [Luteolibacter sp.]
MTPVFREWRADDNVEELTTLLHRAYASLAAKGLRYTATYQTPEVTLRRLTTGHPLVAEIGGRIVGTLTIYHSKPQSEVALYRDPEAFCIGQFGVDPEFQGLGIGKQLHELAVDYTRRHGKRYLALDTAIPAEELIATYQRWGYVIVEHIQFPSPNYESVIMRLEV